MERVAPSHVRTPPPRRSYHEHGLARFFSGAGGPHLTLTPQKGVPHVSRTLRNVGFRGHIPLGILLIHPTLSRTLNPKEPTMTIEIRDASLEARIRKQLQATGSSSVEEVLLRLLEPTSVLSS
jgi:hypothetical protein